MDYQHADFYNNLIKRRCPCGGAGEMLLDYVDDFVVRCSRCHLSTHAYIEPEEAAGHWNRQDDILPDPLTIFQDDPNSWLRGEVTAIHISDVEFTCINHQSCDFLRAVIEYTGGLLLVKHVPDGEYGAFDFMKIDSFNPECYPIEVLPNPGARIVFEALSYEDNRLDGITYRWDSTWLHIFTSEYNLIFTRSSFDLNSPTGWPSPEGEPTLPLRWMPFANP